MHASTISGGKPGVLHGTRSYVLQDSDGQTVESHSISAGLDYPGVGPEHAYLMILVALNTDLLLMIRLCMHSLYFVNQRE